MAAPTRPDLAQIPVYVPGKITPGAIKLSSNESPYQLIEPVKHAITASLESGNRYPDNATFALREALSKYLSVPVENIACSCGSITLCEELIQATCHPGDEVMFAWRSFEAYPLLTHTAHATAVKIPLTSNFEHDFPAMLQAISKKTRVIFVCTPNNPTGGAVSRIKFEEFLSHIPDDVIVVLDEAYFEYNRSDLDGVGLMREYLDDFASNPRTNLIVLRTFSKAFGLAGLRVGYAVGDRAVLEAMGKVRVPFNVSTVAQTAAVTSIAYADEILPRTDVILLQRERLRGKLLQLGIQVLPSAANFVWLPLKDRADDFAQQAAAQGIFVRPFSGDGVRVTIGSMSENDKFIQFVSEYCSSTSLS